MKLLKPVLRNLNRDNYSGITLRVKEQTAKLNPLQRQLLTSPDTETARVEHLERAKWLILVAAEKKFYRQKSRVQWHHLGDRDTPFYHKTVIQRANKNHIHFLKDDDDRLIGSFEDIKAHSAEFFKGVLGATDLSESPCLVTDLQDLLTFSVGT